MLMMTDEDSDDDGRRGGGTKMRWVKWSEGKKKASWRLLSAGTLHASAQQSSAFLAPETSFLEDDFCMNGGLVGGGEGMVSV